MNRKRIKCRIKWVMKFKVDLAFKIESFNICNHINSKTMHILIFHENFKRKIFPIYFSYQAFLHTKKADTNFEGSMQRLTSNTVPLHTLAIVYNYFTSWQEYMKSFNHVSYSIGNCFFVAPRSLFTAICSICLVK